MKKIIIKWTLHVNLVVLMLIGVSCDNYLDLVPKGSSVITTVEEYSQMMNLEMLTGYDNGIHCTSQMTDEIWFSGSAMLGSTNESLSKIHFLFKDNPTENNRLDYYTNYYAYARYYDNISRMNIIMAYIDDAKGDDEELRKRTKAEAQFLNAYYHFILMNLFTKPYDPATAGNENGIVIRDRFDLSVDVAQSTVEAGYQHIESWINKAIPHLSDNPTNVYHPSKAAGWAFKAKMHLFKKEYAKAKEAALESYQLNHQLFDLISYKAAGGIKNRVNAQQNPENMYYGFGTSSVNTITISPELTNLFKSEPDDLRRSLFFVNATGVVEDNTYCLKYNVTLPVFAQNSSGLRTSEILLILAECYAREGDLTTAMKYIDELREKRIENYASKTKASASTKKEAMDVILTERRKELLFGFNRFFDLRRLSNDPDYAITVTKVFPTNPASAYGPQKTYTLNPNSYLYTLPIPRDVLERDHYLINNTPEVFTR